ncbi:MAG: hypothetical protein MZW92_29910 [Comamonadaceae bacterium]|nr:hypothetical protein [Comamonadaceae bacterium]
MAYLWLTWVLGRFPWTRPWGEELGQFFFLGGEGLRSRCSPAAPRPRHRDVHRPPHATPRETVERVLRRDRGRAVERLRSPRRNGQADAAHRRHAILWIFALIMAYPYLPGSGSEAFKGVGVDGRPDGLHRLERRSSASSASGFMILYARTSSGSASYVRRRATWRERSRSSSASSPRRSRRPGTTEIVTIPNAVLASATLTKNYSRCRRTRTGSLLATRASRSATTRPWRQVEALLLLAADRTEGLKKEPGPVRPPAGPSTDFYVEYEV